MSTKAFVVALTLLTGAARADSVDLLRDFASNVKSGRAAFTQTVTSVDGKKKKDSSGQFEFVRPDRFRFSYAKPFEQQIVADGHVCHPWSCDRPVVCVRVIDCLPFECDREHLVADDRPRSRLKIEERRLPEEHLHDRDAAPSQARRAPFFSTDFNRTQGTLSERRPRAFY